MKNACIFALEMNEVMKDSMKNYEMPLCKVIEVKAQSVICNSVMTERFTVSSSSYDETDWE